MSTGDSLGVNSAPPPFRCPPEHRDALEAVKRAIGITHSYQDAWIHLFLVNKKLNVEETVAKLHRRDAMEQTEFMNYDMTPALLQSMSAGIVQYVGADKTGRSTLLMTTCRDFPKSSERAERQMNMDMWLSWAARVQRSNPTSEVTWLIDQKDSGVMKNMDLVFQKNMALRISKYYPGVVGRMYICNMSTALSFVLKPLLKQLPKTISETIFVFSSGDVKRGALLEMFDENVLPVSLGGKNRCDGEANWKLFASTTEKYFNHCKRALQSGISIKQREMMDEYNVDAQGNPIPPKVEKKETAKAESKLSEPVSKTEPSEVNAATETGTKPSSASSSSGAAKGIGNNVASSSANPGKGQNSAASKEPTVSEQSAVASDRRNSSALNPPSSTNDPHSVEDARVQVDDGDEEELMDPAPLPLSSPPLKSPEKSMQGTRFLHSRSVSVQGSFTDDDARFYEPMSARTTSPPDIADLLLESSSNGSFLQTMLVGNDGADGAGGKGGVRETSMDDLIDGCHTLNPSIGFPSEAVASAAFAGLIVDAIAGATTSNESKSEDSLGVLSPPSVRHADPNSTPTFQSSSTPLSSTTTPCLSLNRKSIEKVPRGEASSSTFTTPTTALLSPEQRYAWKAAILQLQNQGSPRDVSTQDEADSQSASKESRNISAFSSMSLRRMIVPTSPTFHSDFDVDEPTSALFAPCHSIIVPDRTSGDSSQMASRTRRQLRRGDEHQSTSYRSSAFHSSEHVSPSVTHISGSSPVHSPLDLKSETLFVPPVSSEPTKETNETEKEAGGTQETATATAQRPATTSILSLQHLSALPTPPPCNSAFSDRNSVLCTSNLCDTISCFRTNCSVLLAMASRLLIEVRDVATDRRGDVAALSSKLPLLGQLTLDLLRVFPPITGHSIEYPLFGWLCGEQNNTEFASFFDYTYVSSVACNSQEEFLISIYQTAAESMALMDDGVDEYKCRLRILRRLRLLWQPSVTRETIIKQMRSRAASHWQEVTATLDTYTSLKLSLSILQYVIHGNLLLPGGRINTNAEWFTSLLSSMQDYHERTRQQWLFAVLPPKSYSEDPAFGDSVVMSPTFSKQVSMVGNTVLVDHAKASTPPASSPTKRNSQSFPDMKRNNSSSNMSTNGTRRGAGNGTGSLAASYADVPSQTAAAPPRHRPAVHMKHIVKNLGLPMNLSSACLCMTTTKNFIAAAADQLNPAHWQHVSVYHMTQQFLEHAAADCQKSKDSHAYPFLKFASGANGLTASINIPEDQQHDGEPAGEALLHIQQEAYHIVENLEPILSNYLFCEALVFALETDFASSEPSAIAEELRHSSGPLADMMEQRVQGKLLASSLCGTVLDLRSQQMEDLQTSLVATLQGDTTATTTKAESNTQAAKSTDKPRVTAEDFRSLSEASYEGYTLAMELILLIASVQWRASVATTMVSHNAEESCSDAAGPQESEDMTNDDESFLRDNSSFSFTAFQSISLASSFCQVVETADRLAKEVREHIREGM